MVTRVKGFTRVKKVQINSGTMFNMATNKTVVHTLHW